MSKRRPEKHEEDTVPPLRARRLAYEGLSRAAVFPGRARSYPYTSAGHGVALPLRSASAPDQPNLLVDHRSQLSSRFGVGDRVAPLGEPEAQSLRSLHSASIMGIPTLDVGGGPGDPRVLQTVRSTPLPVNPGSLDLRTVLLKNDVAWLENFVAQQPTLDLTRLLIFDEGNYVSPLYFCLVHGKFISANWLLSNISHLDVISCPENQPSMMEIAESSGVPALVELIRRLQVQQIQRHQLLAQASRQTPGYPSVMDPVICPPLGHGSMPVHHPYYIDAAHEGYAAFSHDRPMTSAEFLYNPPLRAAVRFNSPDEVESVSGLARVQHSLSAPSTMSVPLRVMEPLPSRKTAQEHTREWRAHDASLYGEEAPTEAGLQRTDKIRIAKDTKAQSTLQSSTDELQYLSRRALHSLTQSNVATTITTGKTSKTSSKREENLQLAQAAAIIRPIRRYDKWSLERYFNRHPDVDVNTPLEIDGLTMTPLYFAITRPSWAIVEWLLESHFDSIDVEKVPPGHRKPLEIAERAGKHRVVALIKRKLRENSSEQGR